MQSFLAESNKNKCIQYFLLYKSNFFSHTISHKGSKKKKKTHVRKYEKGATVEENRKTETEFKTNMERGALSVKHYDIKRCHIYHPPKKDLSCAFPDCSWDISVLSICAAFGGLTVLG